MKVSTRGRYGLRAMVDLARRGSENPVPLRLIAEHEGISEPYLEQVFAALRKAHLVEAVRGARGGYVLARSASTITAADILTTLEGPIVPVDCVDDTSGAANCDRQNHCTTRHFWTGLRDTVQAYLESVTLQDLVEAAVAAEEGQPMYHI